jgi:fido (protein-threonine AMPylation protein)
MLIYPFPNGNGRHARLMADLMSLGGERFTWGGGSDLVSENELKGGILKR